MMMMVMTCLIIYPFTLASLQFIQNGGLVSPTLVRADCFLVFYMCYYPYMNPKSMGEIQNLPS